MGTVKVHSVREFQKAGADYSSKVFLDHPPFSKDASLISSRPMAVGALAPAICK